MSGGDFKGKKGLARLWRATGYSRDGIAAAWRNEAAFREEVLLALDGAIQRTFEGRGEVVHVEGESGAGKSRLLDEIGRRAAERGAHVLRGQALDSIAEGPLQILRARGPSALKVRSTNFTIGGAGQELSRAVIMESSAKAVPASLASSSWSLLLERQ